MAYHDDHECDVTEAHVHPEDFGAVGDGITNDSPAIQAAISACEAGGMVKFQSREYRINEPLDLGGYSVGGGGTISG
jgi:hypothetical protein